MQTSEVPVLNCAHRLVDWSTVTGSHGKSFGTTLLCAPEARYSPMLLASGDEMLAALPPGKSTHEGQATLATANLSCLPPVCPLTRQACIRYMHIRMHTAEGNRTVQLVPCGMWRLGQTFPPPHLGPSPSHTAHTRARAHAAPRWTPPGSFAEAGEDENTCSHSEEYCNRTTTANGGECRRVGSRGVRVDGPGGVQHVTSSKSR